MEPFLILNHFLRLRQYLIDFSLSVSKPAWLTLPFRFSFFKASCFIWSFIGGSALLLGVGGFGVGLGGVLDLAGDVFHGEEDETSSPGQRRSSCGAAAQITRR